MDTRKQLKRLAPKPAQGIPFRHGVCVRVSLLDGVLCAGRNLAVSRSTKQA